ncbi:hypothetical protein CcaverHIS002_0113070 [Cutaneotrichosporon cavernicola]|uniref:DUF567-domain-containing protein n=1 Tax=Cutaneotrichosporon cavernicola TaxID=279322 RepID=A0AA48ICV6_9TREE|nr:uncharacterized protein CcaverHIS019_0112940 [Cutaneotrichosporon cavernicola]BEI80778.1 hypothetical protein CcaverHIS002_0113070 [Cutaneotrichosporon cavernicola]BEI88576.1 hypothetical protein CcaverHIS019_0112940 [Cutaneotrichosporon cavernicola]BEI96349.1 hypothetical protein CcaverHIS631_0112980 [Cutaneotrichosporon cavernicola]BEJ04121.1 hypothetical protein CcaverHIS641_0112960 [Cutaneotrichosporon cavernicola]
MIDRSQIPMLYPAPMQLEVVPGFAVGIQVTLVLKETFDNFSIRDLDDQPVLNVKSRFGLARRKDFVDNYGNTVFSLKGKKYTFTGMDSNQREVLSVHSPVVSADTKLDATVINTLTHSHETVTITGRWPGDIVEIFWQGHLIALIMRQFTKRDIVGQNTYIMTVAPNVDLCIMAALCVCMDERREAT